MKYLYRIGFAAILSLPLCFSGCGSSTKTASSENAKDSEERAKRRQEEKERQKKLALERDRAMNYSRLQTAFDMIPFAQDQTTKEHHASEALKVCSGEVPITIVLRKTGAQKEYDTPTTLRKYLDFLKESKANPNRVNLISYDEGGKIREIEMIRK